MGSTLSMGWDQRVLLMLKGESPTPQHVTASYNQRELRLPPQQGHTGTSPVQMMYQTQAHHAQPQTPAVGHGPVALVPQPTISTPAPMYAASTNPSTPNPQLTHSMQRPTPLPPPGPQQVQGLVPRVPNRFLRGLYSLTVHPVHQVQCQTVAQYSLVRMLGLLRRHFPLHQVQCQAVA